MAQPLFTAAELGAYKKQYGELERRSKNQPWSEYWAEKEALDRAIQIEIVRRVKNRPLEFLDALLVLVGSRGSFYTDFLRAFSDSDRPVYRIQHVGRFNTPENRLILHTILKALTEIPKSWARSALVRFLRGTGKQKSAKYHGAGSLGPQYGWTEREVNAVCEVIAGKHDPYGKALMSYADVQDEINEADPDFEVVDNDVQFKATRVERDIELINNLCKILEKRGLASVPDKKELKPKKAHVPKVFKSGDIIRRGTIRDLPLPAHVKISIERLNEESKDWVKDSLERVIVALGNDGDYHYLSLDPRSPAVAYRSGFLTYDSKSNLCGATFIGPWKGRIEKGKELKINFRYRFVN